VNIVQITRLYSPHIGGVEKVVNHLSKKLVRMGHDVSIITSKYRDSLQSYSTEDGVNIFRINSIPIRFIGLVAIWIQIARISNQIRSADIIHIHDVFLWYIPFRILFPFKKVFITFHGWEGTHITFNSLMQKKLASLLSNKTMVVGEYLTKIYGIKSQYVSYGATERISLNKKKLPDTILYLGRLDRSTDLPFLLKFLKKIPKSYKIIFCGDGELRSDCEKIGKVTGFTDPVPYIKRSNIVFAGGYLSVLESLVCKCETVVICVGSIRKMAFKSTPFSKYIHIVTNEASLSSTLRKLISSKAISEKAKKGYNVARFYSWDKLANDYLKFWKD
jgi:glycosyltransferase involved in cell wall biosynthesis